MRKCRPLNLPLQDRVLPVAACWRTNLTLRQLAPLFGTAANPAGVNFPLGKKSPTAHTARSAPASSTPSPA